MDINELGELMVKHGACIRAIPNVIRSVVEARHIKDHPDGKIVYLPEYKREMLVLESVPEHAGQFLIETGLGAIAGVQFRGKKYYNTLDEVAEILVKMDEDAKSAN